MEPFFVFFKLTCFEEIPVLLFGGEKALCRGFQISTFSLFSVYLGIKIGEETVQWSLFFKMICFEQIPLLLFGKKKALF